MPNWTPERYLQLALECREKAARTASPEKELLLELAADYEAQAASRDHRSEAAPESNAVVCTPRRSRNLAQFRSQRRVPD